MDEIKKSYLKEGHYSMYYPTLNVNRKIKKIKNTLAPVSMEILSDFITPIEAYMTGRKHSTCLYVESAKVNESWGRYTFLD